MSSGLADFGTLVDMLTPLLQTSPEAALQNTAVTHWNVATCKKLLLVDPSCISLDCFLV